MSLADVGITSLEFGQLNQVYATISLSAGWSIFVTGVADGNGDQGLHYERPTRPVHSEATTHEYEARRCEIPDDTRNVTAFIFGDPLPARSALARRRPDQ